MNVSRDLIGAIHDAADSAVDTAAQLVPRRHRRHWATRPTTIAVATIFVIAVAALLWRSRSDDGAGDSQARSDDRSGAAADDRSQPSSDRSAPQGEAHGDGRERDRVGARASTGARTGDSVQPPIPD